MGILFPISFSMLTVLYCYVEMIIKKKSGFTLMELLIIVALIAIIATAMIILLNPMQQINKARDAQTKSNLSTLKKAFEDYYNDKSCYPKPNEVCYNAKAQYAPLEAIICNICGNQSAPPNFANFSPYLSHLPCDPRSPTRNYLYQVDDVTCPKWYRVYSELDNKTDQIIDDLACSGESCGPPPNYGFDYGVTSPNIDLQRTVLFLCFDTNGACNACGGGTYESCNDPALSPGCQTYKKFYPSYIACCEENSICTATYYCKYAITSECIACGYSNGDCIATGKCKLPIQTKRGSCPL